VVGSPKDSAFYGFEAVIFLSYIFWSLPILDFAAQYPPHRRTCGRRLCRRMAVLGQTPDDTQVKDGQIQQGVLIVKNYLLSAATVAAIASLVVSDSVGQNSSTAPPPGPTITVIDISEVFKKHPGFKQQMEAMKRDVQAFEAELTRRGKEIEQLREQMRMHKLGTPKYKELETQIATKQADGQATTQLKRKEFLEREAMIYYQVYTDISTVVQQFATRYRIRLVLRFNSREIEPQDRNSVLEGVNRNVVFQNKLDITQQIIETIERRSNSGVAKQPARPGTARARK
jgi:Skp family chaperone for outer membrane proteins